MNREPPLVAGRVPAHDLDAEAAVLSAVLLCGRDAIDRADLEPRDFYSDANGRIYEAAIELRNASTPVDVISVASWLRDRDRLAQIGGAGYLAQIADATPSVVNLEAHADIVHRKARMRRAVAEAQHIAAEGYGDVGDELEWLARAPDRIAVASGAADAAPEGADARQAICELWDNWKNPDSEISISTGLPDLDRLIGGLLPGHLVTVAAHSGNGKTALVSGIADHVALEERAGGAPCGVAVFSLEMKRAEYLTRMISARTRINNAKFLPRNRDRITSEEWGEIEKASKRLACHNLWIDDRVPLRPSQIRTACRKLARQWQNAGHPLRIVVIDYVQIVTPDTAGARRRDTREQEVASVGRAAKELAQELNITVLLAAQLNQESVRAGRRPRASDLRESTALMNDSNAVVLIYNEAAEAREAAYRNDEDVAAADELEPVDLIAGKVRSGGKKGTVRALFRTTCTRFESWKGDPRELHAEPMPAANSNRRRSA